ncbi:MAG TPA: hypothetical protein VH640_04780 [Bryobacteraceae bacterium]
MTKRVAPQHGVPGVDALKEIEQQLVGMRQVPQVGLGDRSAGDRDPFEQRICHPISPFARIQRGIAFEVNPDRSRRHENAIVVVINAVPSGVESRVIAPYWSRRAARWVHPTLSNVLRVLSLYESPEHPIQSTPVR